MSSASTRYQPCLPKPLLDKMKHDSVVNAITSDVYGEALKIFRAAALASREFNREMEVVVSGRRRTFLHFAVVKTDLLLAYEAIRLGTAINMADRDGITPLFLACYTLRQYRKSQASSNTAAPTSLPLGRGQEACGTSREIDEACERLQRIATLFIEQHADLDTTVECETPLSVAAEAACWPLVELLIRHGATVPTVGQAGYPRFRTTIARSRFQSFVRTTKRAVPRPPRPCPCWSGKLLKDCHAASELPYPDDFLCHCGRDRPYGRCCASRDFWFVERWSTKDGRIVQEKDFKVLPTDDALQAGIARSQELIERLNEADGFDFDALDRDFAALCVALLAGAPLAVADPAFLYAMRTVGFVVLPFVGHLSRAECKRRAEEWNAAVDAYIASGVDDRPAFDIELNAKIGPNCGPLYKRCEGQNCSNTERRDVEKMKYCSRCRLIVYCSQACQVEDWPRHKVECEARSHRTQMLGTQAVIRQHVEIVTRVAAPYMDVESEFAKLLDSTQPKEEVS